MVLDPYDAEDVTQEILIKMITKLPAYDSGKAAFRTWLYRIVVNRVINMKKKKYEEVISNNGHISDYFTVVNSDHILYTDISGGKVVCHPFHA